MTLRATLLGSPRLARRLRLIPRERKAAVSTAIAEGARMLQREIRSSLSRPGTSNAGQAPSRDSGRLARSVTIEVASDGLSAEVGSALDYGRYLEFGTRSMAARPWLSPAFRRLAPVIKRRLLSAARGES